jgi:hypothetical protein
MDWENAYKSLLGCMIGTVSGLDLLYVREQLKTLYTEELYNHYIRSVDSHCGMSIYDEPEEV